MCLYISVTRIFWLSSFVFLLAIIGNNNKKIFYDFNESSVVLEKKNIVLGGIFAVNDSDLLCYIHKTILFNIGLYRVYVKYERGTRRRKNEKKETASFHSAPRQ